MNDVQKLEGLARSESLWMFDGDKQTTFSKQKGMTEQTKKILHS